MRDRHFGGLAQCLIDDAIALCQTNECTQLVGRRVGVEGKVQANPLKSNRHLLGDTQRAAKIEIAFGTDHAVANDDAYCRRNGIERHTRTRDQRFEQHVAGACALAVAAGCRMQPCLNEGRAGLHVAGNSLAKPALGF